MFFLIEDYCFEMETDEMVFFIRVFVLAHSSMRTVEDMAEVFTRFYYSVVGNAYLGINEVRLGCFYWSSTIIS